MLGIDIGNRSIKIVDTTVKKDSISINNFAVELLPENIIDNDNIIEPKSLVRILRSLIERYKLKGKANFVLCSSQVMIRDLELPTNMKTSELESSVYYEMEQILPGITGNSVIDFRPKKDGKVMVCSAPIELIKEYADIIKEAGLKLQAVDVMCNSIAKLYKRYVNTTGAMAVIDLGHSKLDVTVISDGEINLNKTFNSGNSRIDELIANYYNLSIEEADRVKRSGFKGYNITNDDLERYLRFSYENILGDIKKLFEFFNSRNRGKEVSQVVLTGGGTLFSGVDLYFEKMLGMPTTIFKPSSRIKVNPQLYLQNIIYFLPALGATIRED